MSLNRWEWEWNRALFFGLIVLIAEVALASRLLSRLSRLTAALEIDPTVLDALRETRPPHPNRFEWLASPVGEPFALHRRIQFRLA